MASLFLRLGLFFNSFSMVGIDPNPGDLVEVEPGPGAKVGIEPTIVSLVGINLNPAAAFSSFKTSSTSSDFTDRLSNHLK